MRIHFLLLLVVTLFLGCNNPSSTNLNAAGDELKIIQKQYADSSSKMEIGEMYMGRTTIDLKWIEFEGGKEGVASKINATIENEIIRGITSVSGTDKSTNDSNPANIEAAAASFISNYEQINDEIGGEIPWQLSVYLNREYSSDKILSLHVNTESYTGGAHGYNGNYYLHFNPEIGDKIDILTFISDTVALKNLLAQNYRIKYNLKETDPMSMGGLFDMYYNVLPLPREMAFSTQGLIAIYNPYDIAPYFEGTIVLTLNQDEVKKVVKDGVKP